MKTPPVAYAVTGDPRRPEPYVEMRTRFGGLLGPLTPEQARDLAGQLLFAANEADRPTP